MLEDYKKQSLFTNPRDHAYLFDDLPRDISTLKKLVHGLLLHMWDASAKGYSMPLSRFKEVHLRYVSKQLDLLMRRDPRNLRCQRIWENRVLGSCRDFALLLCAILRHQGIAVRVRVAFNLYYLKDFYHDQVILEYWNEEKKRYCRVDPRITQAYMDQHNINITFDCCDVPRNQLMTAGEAWLFVREKPELANQFGGGDRKKNKGLWYIRDRLIQDHAALQGMEMQLWDVWGKMHMSIESLDEAAVLKYFDHLATLTLNPEKNAAALMRLFNEDKESLLQCLRSQS